MTGRCGTPSGTTPTGCLKTQHTLGYQVHDVTKPHGGL